MLLYARVFHRGQPHTVPTSAGESLHQLAAITLADDLNAPSPSPQSAPAPRVSVIVITRNAASCLPRCLEAIRRQSVATIDIVIVDDDSTDQTEALIASLNDPRVIYTRNERHEGRSRSRNRGLGLAGGELVFFTDADCAPIRTWVEEGLRAFAASPAVGVEGRTLPASPTVSLAHRSVLNEHGGQWQTCNMAYRHDVLRKAGGFDERYLEAYEDRDLALRVRRHGPIVFCPDMLVFHDVVGWTWSGIVANARRGRDRVRLIAQHGDDEGRCGIVVEPRSLVVLLFPLLMPLYYPIRSGADILGLAMLWVRALLLRVIIWRAAWGARRWLV